MEDSFSDHVAIHNDKRRNPGASPEKSVAESTINEAGDAKEAVNGKSQFSQKFASIKYFEVRLNFLLIFSTFITFDLFIKSISSHKYTSANIYRLLWASLCYIGHGLFPVGFFEGLTVG
jgi:hypothetical protein